MAARTTFVVQGFEHVGGRLVSHVREVAPDEGHALRQAEALARRLPGAAALKLVAAEGAAGRAAETTTILGAFGDVPDDLLDGLAGG